MQWGLLVGAGAFFLATAAACPGQEPAAKSSSDAAIAAIRKLGGEVKIAADQGAPVTVVLTGAKQPAQCVPLLKDVANLRQCDL
jgi:hypothetical protein